MNRYDDPRWFEEPHQNQAFPAPPYDDFDQHPSYNHAHSHQPLPTPLYDKEQRRRQIVGQVLVTAALMAIAFFGGWFCHQYFGGTTFNASNQSKAYAQLLQQAWTTVDQNYVDRQQVNYKAMSYAAIQAMVNSLQDKGHSRFLTPQQVQDENQQLSGKFVGIGIYLRQDPQSKRLIITAPIPGSPAEKAGLKPGDAILAVNGKSVIGMNEQQLSSLTQGPEGTTVSLTIQRPGAPQPMTIHMTRAVITIPNVIMHYIPESHIADIQISQFSDGVSGQLKDALTQAKSMGATRFILDLRNDPGGYLSEAINTASLFMKNGNVLLEQDSSGKRTPVAVNGNSMDTNAPLVVLVNENTASAAEIVSGALQDNKRATILGEKTFGTGTVLQQFNLADGSAILLGTQEWLTPDGHFIRNQGITPNITVPLSSNATALQAVDENAQHMTEQQILKSGDTQLIKAIKYLSS